MTTWVTPPPIFPANPVFPHTRRALELLGKHVGVVPQVLLLRAQVNYLNGNLEAAQRMASDVLRSNPEDYQVRGL